MIFQKDTVKITLGAPLWLTSLKVVQISQISSQRLITSLEGFRPSKNQPMYSNQRFLYLVFSRRTYQINPLDASYQNSLCSGEYHICQTALGQKLNCTILYFTPWNVLLCFVFLLTHFYCSIGLPLLGVLLLGCVLLLCYYRRQSPFNISRSLIWSYKFDISGLKIDDTGSQ